ncbi:hypothetical protein [Dyadobacter sediminis]|uniref:Uncharacterized protein n=1 Tax=Dyadobacter sediminis TaxID=1493691 RepID=A0A5R9K644_9BACT|nr:hypothetical protein [Dyadobacter sediminis]TLU89114.1 hypothetical protein FEM55_23795 [Dyadobacter sediminis]
MKNRQTLIISSVLLALCVFEKNASDKASKIENAKNMFNTTLENYNNRIISDKTAPEINENEAVEKPDYQRYAMLQSNSADSTSGSKLQSKL